MENSGTELIRSALLRIKTTTQILQEVKSTNLKLERGVFLKPMYENTPLDRRIESSNAPHENDDVILRKNIFYIATKIQNPNDLILTLMHGGLLSSDEIEDILPLKTNILKSIAIFALVITKDQNSEQFSVFLDALRKSSHGDLANMLESSAGKPEKATKEKAHHSNGKEKTASSSSKEYWTCQNCTFHNTSPAICEMCFKTKDYKSATRGATLVCQRCTFFNDPGNSHCEMCNHPLCNPSGSEDEERGDDDHSDDCEYVDA